MVGMGALALWTALAAEAGAIAVVDFQAAVTMTNEGKTAQSKIDQMYTARKAEIDRMKADFERELSEYQSRAMLLTDSAKAQAEGELMQKQQAFEQKYVSYQQEIQATYGQLLDSLDQKMRAVSVTVAKEKGYTLVLDKQAVVYQAADVVDMTSALVAKYNAVHP